MVEKLYSFAVNQIEQLNLDAYPDDEFAVVKLGFLSDEPNSHELDISEEVLRNDAESALGKFIVARILLNDTMAHETDQDIFGYVPKEQEIEFTQEGKYTRASCIAVISKVYAEDFCAILERDGVKSVSVEMAITTTEEEPDTVISFRIFGITVLGERYKPSCPNSTIELVRFSEEKANDFYSKIHGMTSQLHQFAQSRREQFMAETKKTYKVDKSKKSVSTKIWGDVDKTELRDKIMEASNRDSLVKDVYMLVEDGWEDAPSEHLKYPVMCFDGDTLVYNRDGLASALGYANKEKETTVVTKVEKIYKKLGLDYEGKEEDAKMNKEVEFAAVNIGDLWGRLFDALHNKYPDGEWGSIYRIDGIYEEDNKKFAIIRHKDEDAKYRLDFSLTEEGLDVADEIIKIEIEFIETDEIRKFAEPEDAKKFKEFEETKPESDEDDDKSDEEAKMSVEEMTSKIAEMQSDIESRDNIIMEKDAELEELRRFKTDIENKEKALFVEAVMADVKECLEEVKFSELREEGMACNLATIDAWSNKVKAVAFSVVKKPKKQNSSGIFEFAAPVATQKPKSQSVWDRLKEQI